MKSTRPEVDSDVRYTHAEVLLSLINQVLEMPPSADGPETSVREWFLLNHWTGATVEEMVVNYSSTNDARNDFEAELKNGGTVIERSDSTNVNYQRAVKVFGDANTQGASEIITLSDQQIQFVKAGALKYALRF